MERKLLEKLEFNYLNDLKTIYIWSFFYFWLKKIEKAFILPIIYISDIL